MIIVNKACIDLIKEREGLSLKAYHDAIDKPSVDTIGFGSILYENGTPVKVGDPDITVERAIELLTWEVNLKAKLIDPLLRDDLTPNQFAALVSFAYNLGEGALKGSTLRKKVNANPNDPTISQEFEKWIFSDGKKVNGLLLRRRAETKLYFTP